MKIKQVFATLAGLALVLLTIPAANAGSDIRIYGGGYHQGHDYPIYHRERHSPYNPHNNYLYSDRNHYKNYRNDRHRYNHYDNDRYYNNYRNNRCGSNSYRDRGYRNNYRPHRGERTYIYIR